MTKEQEFSPKECITLQFLHYSRDLYSPMLPPSRIIDVIEECRAEIESIVSTGCAADLERILIVACCAIWEAEVAAMQNNQKGIKNIWTKNKTPEAVLSDCTSHIEGTVEHREEIRDAIRLTFPLERILGAL